MSFCLGLMWICTKQLRLRQDPPPPKYGSNTSPPFITFRPPPPFPLLLPTDRRNVYILHI